MFFKKVQVILKKLPIYLKEIDITINQEGNHLFNFFHELDDRSYFIDSKDIRGFIRVNYIPLSDNIYQITVLVKNSPIPIISYINVNSELYIIMKSNIDRTYITNTLSYTHLLPKNKQIERSYEILHYFNTNSRKRLGDLSFIKLINKAIYSFKKL